MPIIARRAVLATVPFLLAWHCALAAPPVPIVIFGFSLDNTSPAASTPEELARTASMGPKMAAILKKSGLYAPVDGGKGATDLNGLASVRNCNGCELPVAKKLGATLAAYGWVQKVSNLILNINVVVENVDTGKMVAGGSVDIRGNTDESWDRGLDFLLQEHVLPRS